MPKCVRGERGRGSLRGPGGGPGWGSVLSPGLWFSLRAYRVRDERESRAPALCGVVAGLR